MSVSSPKKAGSVVTKLTASTILSRSSAAGAISFFLHSKVMRL
jgi:hypothetical protein